jgi:hypothetical protein
VTKLMLRTIGLAIVLIIGRPAAPVYAQYNSTDSRQHGYEHGYRDGADRGRQDSERGLARNFNDGDYRAGTRDYDPAFGSEREYMSGYQEGYRVGYDDGYDFYNRPGRYGELYGGRTARGNQGASATRPSSRGFADRAFDAGYREGVAAGEQDRRQNVRSDFRRSRTYQNGDAEYQSGFGDRNEYRQNFRDGFERGYQDGYGRSRYSTDGGGYFPNRGTTGPADTRDGVGASRRTVVVSATRQWTPTSIRVNQGDRIWIQATGEIHWTPNPNDRAISAGALSQTRTPGAPLPNALAGALIGRIDGGQPFGIGNQTSIVAPASGLLYLGINDDNVSDNSGQFQVVISW